MILTIPLTHQVITIIQLKFNNIFPVNTLLTVSVENFE